jgi:hypothetical protein
VFPADQALRNHFIGAADGFFFAFSKRGAEVLRWRACVISLKQHPCNANGPWKVWNVEEVDAEPAPGPWSSLLRNSLATQTEHTRPSSTRVVPPARATPLHQASAAFRRAEFTPRDACEVVSWLSDCWWTVCSIIAINDSVDCWVCCLLTIIYNNITKTILE